MSTTSIACREKASTETGRAPLRALAHGVLPFLLTGVAYRTQGALASRWVQPGDVHVADLYAWEQALFGIRSASGDVLTPNEWWARHTHWSLDFVLGSAYLLFIPAFLGFCAYFLFGCSDPETRRRAPRLVWSFFWVNLLGYATYLVFPAAPPWYFARYGAGPADLTAAASAAGAARFDELLGVRWFELMYAGSANVFGAMPSLHVAYPLLVVVFALSCGIGRASALLFYVLMCWAAVYLNHHYLLDVALGSFYALIVAFAMSRRLSSETRSAGALGS